VPLYLAGARMEGLYPLSIVVHGVALNITVQSYRGQLCFGLIACRRAVPDISELAMQLGRAMEGLRRLPVPAVAEVAAAQSAPAPAPEIVAKHARRPAGRAKPRLAVVGAATEAVEPLDRITAQAPAQSTAQSTAQFTAKSTAQASAQASARNRRRRAVAASA
jgi:hypothetical protein